MALLRDVLRGSRGHSLEDPSKPLTDAGLLSVLGGERSAAGVAVTEASAMGLTAVFRAVALTSGTAAMFPLESYRLRGPAGERVAELAGMPRRLRAEETELRQHEADLRAALNAGTRAHLPADRVAERVPHALLLDPAGPDSDVTAFEFWETELAHAMLWGNSYAFKERNGLGEVKRLVQLDPGRMRVGRAKDRTKVFGYMTDTGEQVGFTSREIFHVPALSTDGTLGLSPIRVARTAIALGIALEKFGAQLFEKGTLPSGVLETDMRLEEEDAEALKRRWNQKMSGIENAHEVAILDRGAKFHQLTIPPEDAQFIESRRFSVVEVARLFGVPPSLLMDQEKSTSWGTGLEVMVQGWITFGLGLWLSRFAARATKELTPRGQVCEHDTSALRRGDSEARARFYGMGIRDGWMARSEPRRWEGLPAGPKELDEFVDPAGTAAADAGIGAKGSPKSADGSPAKGGSGDTDGQQDG